MTIGRKTSRYDFHETYYYDHSCSIIDMKDVLETDIKGNNSWSRFKRRWHGLFLLSHSDERSRKFYTSSHAIRMERIRQFRGYQGRIHPLSKFRNIWDCVIFILFVLDVIAFHHNSSITFGHMSSFFYYYGALFELVIIVDLFINLNTGFIDQENKKIILEKLEGLLRYGSTKLFLHVASAIPLHCLIIMRYGCNYDCTICKTNKFMFALKILSTFRLFRMYETSSYLIRERTSYKLIHFLRFLRIYVIGFFSLLLFFDLTDMISLMYMISVGTLEADNHVALIIELRFLSNDPHSNFKIINYNFVRIGKIILLYRFGEINIKFNLEKIITLATFIIVNLFHFRVLLECYSFISEIQFAKDALIIRKNTTQNLLISRKLPEFLNSKLNKYFEYKQAKMKVIANRNGLLKSLPPILKRDVYRAMYFRLVARIHCFSEWPTVIIEDLVDIMKEDIYLKDDMVAESGVPSEGLFVVAMGEVAVYSRGGNETAHLIDGDYFGELSLVTDTEVRTSSAVALTPCVILLLEKSLFRIYMRRLPSLFYQMIQQLEEKYNNKA